VYALSCHDMSTQMTMHPQLLAMLLVKKLVMCIELVHGMLGTDPILCGCDELLSFLCSAGC